MKKKTKNDTLEHKIDLLSNIVEQGFNSVGGKVNSLEKKVTRGFKSVEERMERGFATVVEDIADIQEIMATKSDIADVRRDMATKKDIEGIVSSAHNRIDQESQERKQIDVRVGKIEKHLGFKKPTAV